MQDQIPLRTNDIVHLNSGSPDLKIVALDGEKATVEWRDDEGVIQAMTLPNVCLRLAVRAVA